MHKKRKNKGKKPVGRLSTGGRRSGFSMIASEEEPRESVTSPTMAATWKSTARPGKAQPEMNTMDMIRYIQNRPTTAFARKARLFLLSLALCHTCLPEVQDDGEIDFQAASPDELALVRAAQEMGYLVFNRDAKSITLRHMAAEGLDEEVTEIYEILDVIEFSSKRKRMSVIVRFPDGRHCVICKGADSMVLQRLRLATFANQKVVEIEKRANRRKSLEAQYVQERKSEQNQRNNSITRPSLSIGRPSMGGLGRASLPGGPRLQSVRDEVDGWLTDREHDIDASKQEDTSTYYSPRPSAQIGRPSFAASEGRSSAQFDGDEEELVEDKLVRDEPAVIERCFQHINDFATEGLRTLLYGYRFLDEQEYQGWKKIYLDATTSIVDRQNMIEKAGELIERDLDLAGATAIEDKLQQGVPESIDRLRRANIKMWMLTGDKRETAINIGHSCRLIKDYSTVTVLDHEAGDVAKNIAATVISIEQDSIAHSVVVIDGQTLSKIETDKALRNLFFDLAILADSVICCRASPSQKAGLVKAIRKRVKKSITLAIGDGANDIAMIQEAHVGIGITGKEGLQAARTSDYSIAQFRFLTKLLLVHGRWNYIRICKYTVGTFWKEMLFYLTQALYQRWAGYTGTSLYESWSLSMFNTLFTSLPVIFMGIFEKDLAASTLLAVPELYTKGQRDRGFNFKVFFGWMFIAASEAMILYFCMLGLFGQVSFTHGDDNDLFAMGDMTFTAAVIVISLKMQYVQFPPSRLDYKEANIHHRVIEMHNKSITAGISCFCSIGGWFLWNLILAATYSNNVIYHVRDAFLHRFGSSILWWLCLILILISVVAFELSIASVRRYLFPQDEDTFEELERDLPIRRRFEEASAMYLQQGWDRGEKKSSLELERERVEQEQADREGHVQELLKNRPETMEEANAAAARKSLNEERGRRSLEMQEMLGRRFGSVRREAMKE